MPQGPLTIGSINDANSLPAAATPVDSSKLVVIQAAGSKKREKATIAQIVSGDAGITTSGGTANTVPKYTGSQTIGPSLLTDNGTTVTNGGSWVVTSNSTTSGSSTIDGTLTVSGGSTLTGDISALGNLAVTSNSTLSGTLTVDGASTLVGNVHGSGTLTIDGGSTLTGAIAAGANVAITGYLQEGVANALSAVGSSRTDALALTHQINRVTTAASSAVGVVLPASSTVGVGGWVDVYLDGPSNSMHVYAAGSDTIDGTAGATGVVLTNGNWCRYLVTAAGAFVSFRSTITRSA